MTVMKEEGNCPNVEQRGMASTETDSSGAMMSRLQPAETRDVLTGEQLTPITNVIYDALARGLGVRGDVFVDVISRNKVL